MKKKCLNGQIENPLKMHGLYAVTATHPSRPNFSGHSRGRKIHLAKDGKFTVCNMLVDEYAPSSSQTYSVFHNGKCGNCFNERAINKVIFALNETK